MKQEKKRGYSKKYSNKKVESEMKIKDYNSRDSEHGSSIEERLGGLAILSGFVFSIFSFSGLSGYAFYENTGVRNLSIIGILLILAGIVLIKMSKKKEI